jgi:hypothetical protein
MRWPPAFPGFDIKDAKRPTSVRHTNFGRCRFWNKEKATSQGEKRTLADVGNSSSSLELGW